MKFEFLGTSSSFGIPEIGCDCEVCLSGDPMDQRLRCCIWIQHEGSGFVVDTPPDFRQQCLRRGIKRLDGVVYTHDHADHVFGLDDIRKFNRLQDGRVPVYVPGFMAERFRRWFYYALEPPKNGLTRPQLELMVLDETPFSLAGLTVTPLPVYHGEMMIYGYLFETDGARLAYLTDCKSLPDDTVRKVTGADVIVLSALWNRDWQHPNHMNLDTAVQLAGRLNGGATYFTHLTHFIGLHQETNATLPDGMFLAHDGLTVDVGAAPS